MIDYSMDFDAYLAVDALSNSGISKILECPARYKYAKDIGFKQTDSMLHGSVFHCLTLEPEAFECRYAIKRENGATKAGKEEKAQAEARNLSQVKIEMYHDALGMASAVTGHSHEFVGGIIRRPDTRKEVSIFWEEDGIKCKARLDILSGETRVGIVISDLKKTKSANPDDISKAIFNYGYHRQAAWYLRGCRAVGIDAKVFILTFVEPETHLVTPAVLLPQVIERGAEECEKGLSIYRQCLSTNKWPCFSDNKILEIDLPGWAYRKTL